MSCPYCGTDCTELVDARFPAPAREAYAVAGYTTVPTCDEGQTKDMERTGWCWDRARFHRYWTGETMTPAERKGAGIRWEQER